MRIRIPLLTLFVALTGAASVASADTAVHYISGQLLVKVKPGQEAAAKSQFRRIGATVIDSIPQIGWTKIKLKQGMTVSRAIGDLKNAKLFANLEANARIQKFEVPNDPLLSQQYSLTRMQVKEAWDYSKAGRDVVIAIIDDGVDSRHPDLVGRVLTGYDFTENDTDTINRSASETHGTHVAGIAAASTNNGIGIAGVAYNASILPVQVFAADGGGSWDWAAKGLVFAADRGAQVANMSLGGYADLSVMKDAVDYAYSKNVIIVASAGNDDVTAKSYPAAYEKVICVGSTNEADTKSDFSNYGADWVDVAAPGSVVLSTVTGNGYERFDGTSMASPNVAGVAALVVARAGVGTLTNDEVRKILEDTTDNVGNWNAKGRVNASRAVLAVGTKVLDEPLAETLVAAEGVIVGGSDPTLVSQTDGVSLVIRSVRKSGVGLSGAASTSFSLNNVTLAELASATITLTASGDRNATLQVFAWDSINSKWVVVMTQPGSTTAKTSKVTLNKAALSKYMVGEELKLLVRSLVPQRLANGARGITNIDKLSVVFQGLRLPGSQP